jgi:hypothetical protein
MAYQAKPRRRGQTTSVVYNRPSIMKHRVPVRPMSPPHRGGLGNLGQITGNPTVDGILESPWLWIGGGLLVTYMVLQSFGKPRRRRKGVITPFTAALYAAGAGALGYLVGGAMGGGSLSNL